METWFTLLDVNGKNRRSAQRDRRLHHVRQLAAAAASSRPYTNLTTLKNVTVTGNVNSPERHGIGRNDVTRNIIYDHVHAEGWETGIDVPVNGINEIDGGFFNDVKGLLISTANSRSRVVNINGNTDATGNLDPTQPQFGTLSATALKTPHAVRHRAVDAISIPRKTTSRGCSIPT